MEKTFHKKKAGHERSAFLDSRVESISCVEPFDSVDLYCEVRS